MKKGKIFTSKHIALVAMVLVLGAAVWLNMKYSSSNKTKYMGETTLVSSEEAGGAAMVGAKAEEDYFEKAKSDRENAYKDAEETVKEAILSAGQDQTALDNATQQAAALGKRKTDEVAIENLLIAKGFGRVLAIIGDDSITVIVEKESLTANETVQIQDAVMSQCSVPLSNIKIVTVNS